MNPHQLSADDRHFLAEFEACRFPPASFDHRAHVRLAYAYLAENDTEATVMRMRNALLAFLRDHDVDISKYHETITRAWILAVRHFMQATPAAPSRARLPRESPMTLEEVVVSCLKGPRC